MISIIIPAREEYYLQNTINDLLQKAKNNIEIIVILDGYWPNPPLENNNSLKIIHFGKSRGMRCAINSGVSISSGEYILKTDAHCSFDKGFDRKLIEDHKDNWVQIPRRKRLNPEKWEIINDGRPDIDYLYLDKNFRGRLCTKKNNDPELKKVLLDDIGAFQGSCWFMKKQYFEKLNLLDESFGGSGHESQEITFKTLIDGGKVIRNKKTWYAHWHKTKSTFKMDRSKSRDYLKYWIEENKNVLKLIKKYEKN